MTYRDIIRMALLANQAGICKELHVSPFDYDELEAYCTRVSDYCKIANTEFKQIKIVPDMSVPVREAHVVYEEEPHGI